MSDARGAAQISLTMGGFSLSSEMAVLGRALVAHLAAPNAATRVACGVIGGGDVPGVSKAVATLEAYPGTADSVRGTFFLSEGDGALRIDGVLSGLPAGHAAGWHIHSGFSCAEASLVGGHYFDGLDDDPWNAANGFTYSSDATGAATLAHDLSLHNFTLTRSRPVLGRVLVVHNATHRIGCALIEPTAAEAAILGAYPGTTATIRGIVLARSPRAADVELSGLLVGLPPSESGGFHVHAGHTCESADGVFGHYFEAGTVDPWTPTNEPPAVYVSDARGAAHISLTMGGFSLYSDAPISQRALVAHLPAAVGGGRMACGLLGGAGGDYVYGTYGTLGVYPGYAGDLLVSGTFSMSARAAAAEAVPSMSIDAVIGGLEPSASGGWHVHTGYTCDDAALVGAHFYDGLAADPWTAMTWHSDASGSAVLSLAIDDFTTQPARTRSVLGRALVVHSAAGARIGCGIITPLAGGLAVKLGEYPGYAAAQPSGGRGLVIERDTLDGVELAGTLVGLQSGVLGGFHVHAGYSCGDAGGVFGHHYAPGTTDPWTPSGDPPAVYASTLTGVSSVRLRMRGFSLYGTMPIYLRAVVVHLQAGQRYLCGVDGLPTAPLQLAPPPSPPLPPPSPSPPPASSSSGLSNGAAAGVGFGCAAAGFALGVAVAALLVLRRDRRRATAPKGALAARVDAKGGTGEVRLPIADIINPDMPIPDDGSDKSSRSRASSTATELKGWSKFAAPVATPAA